MLRTGGEIADDKDGVTSFPTPPPILQTPGLFSPRGDGWLLSQAASPCLVGMSMATARQRCRRSAHGTWDTAQFSHLYWAGPYVNGSHRQTWKSTQYGDTRSRRHERLSSYNTAMITSDLR